MSTKQNKNIYKEVDILKDKIISMTEELHWNKNLNRLLILKLKENNIHNWDTPDWEINSGQLDKCECAECFPSLLNNNCECELCQGEVYNDNLEVNDLDNNNDINSSNCIEEYNDNSGITKDEQLSIVKESTNLETANTNSVSYNKKIYLELYSCDDTEDNRLHMCNEYCDNDCNNCKQDIIYFGFRKKKIIDFIKTRLDKVCTLEERNDKLKIVEEIFLELCKNDGKKLILYNIGFSLAVRKKLEEFYYKENIKKAYYWYRRIFNKRMK